jgi:hypothetical protein
VNRDRVLLVLPFAVSVAVLGALVVSAGSAQALPGTPDLVATAQCVVSAVTAANAAGLQKCVSIPAP